MSDKKALYSIDEDEMFKEYNKNVARTQESSGSGAGVNFFSLKIDEDNVYRHLPPPLSVKRKTPYIETAQHFLTGNSLGKKILLNCTLTSHGVCPICSARKELQMKKKLLEKDPKEKTEVARLDQIIYGLKPSIDYKCCAIDSNGEIGILSIPVKVYNMIYDQIEALKKCMKDKYVSPYDLENGRDIIIKRTKVVNKRNSDWSENVYAVTLSFNTTSIDPSIISDYENKYVNPEKFIRNYTVENLTQALNNDFSFIPTKDPKPESSGGSVSHNSNVKTEQKVEKEEEVEVEDEVSKEVDRIVSEDNDEVDDLDDILTS